MASSYHSLGDSPKLKAENTPWTVAFQAPLSMGFSRQEYWSGLPFTLPGDLSDPGIEPWSPALQADSLLTELLGKIKQRIQLNNNNKNPIKQWAEEQHRHFYRGHTDGQQANENMLSTDNY